MSLATPPDEVFERRDVHQLDSPALHLHEAFLLETRKEPTDGFELHCDLASPGGFEPPLPP